MAKRKTQAAGKRSKKAGQPPKAAATRLQVKRRQRSASAAVKKGTTMLQTDQGTKVAWGANQRRPTKI